MFLYEKYPELRVGGDVLFAAGWHNTVHTINTSLLVSSINEQISGTLWEPWQGQELNESRNGITGKKVLPTRLTAQNLSLKK